MGDVSSSITRASILLRQNRPDLAAAELRQAIAQSPDSATLFCLLSTACFMSEKMEDAENAARRAVELEPNDSESHQALAMALIGRNKLMQAIKSAKQAVELSPSDADAWLVLAMAHSALHNPKEAVAAAERGLELEPDSITLQSLRNNALAHLGRPIGLEEARNTLAADPQDDFSHAVLAGALLKSGDHRQTMVHYKEALRIDPNFEGAREGLLEALKARSWIYRPVLWYTHMLQRLSASQQVVFFIALFGLYFLLRHMPKWAPSTTPYVDVARALLVAMFMFIFLGDPLLNCVLRFDRDGRHVLKPHESRYSLIAGILVLPLAAFWLLWSFTGEAGWSVPTRVFFTVFGSIVLHASIERPKYQQYSLWGISTITILGVAFLVNHYVFSLGIGAYLPKYMLYSLVAMACLYFASLFANED